MNYEAFTEFGGELIEKTDGLNYTIPMRVLHGKDPLRKSRRMGCLRRADQKEERR